MLIMTENPVGQRVVSIGVASGVVITIAVALRLLARWRSKANFAIDDALIIISVLPQYLMITVCFIGHPTAPMLLQRCSHLAVVDKGGMGHPVVTLSPKQKSNFLKVCSPPRNWTLPY